SGSLPEIGSDKRCYIPSIGLDGECAPDQVRRRLIEQATGCRIHILNIASAIKEHDRKWNEVQHRQHIVYRKVRHSDLVISTCKVLPDFSVPQHRQLSLAGRTTSRGLT